MSPVRGPLEYGRVVVHIPYVDRDRCEVLHVTVDGRQSQLVLKTIQTQIDQFDSTVIFTWIQAGDVHLSSPRCEVRYRRYARMYVLGSAREIFPGIPRPIDGLNPGKNCVDPRELVK